MRKEKLPIIAPLKTKRLTIPLDEVLHEELYKVQSEKKIQVTEWLRQVIRRELDSLKAG